MAAAGWFGHACMEMQALIAGHDLTWDGGVMVVMAVPGGLIDAGREGGRQQGGPAAEACEAARTGISPQQSQLISAPYWVVHSRAGLQWESHWPKN
jgi:hypothetical protein